MKNLLIFLVIFSVLLAMSGCVQGPSASEPVPSTTAPRYEIDQSRNEAIVNDAGVIAAANNGNARVYYQIFVGSFSDSDGDGTGDLRGIINRFDYLNDGDDNSGLSLGVEGIWLSPIFKSPSYHKYDVADYYMVDPKFGTEDDLRELIALCHSRNVQIIIDLPLNHTSRQHEWFNYFCNAHKLDDTGNPYYDYYSYIDLDGASNGKTYSGISGSNHKYECNFSTDMPELNYDNEAVRQAMLNVALYYLDMGMDGFRFDASKYIYYGDDDRSARFWDWYLEELRKVKPDIYTVHEVWSGETGILPYYTSGNCFDFSMSQAEGYVAMAAKGGSVSNLVGHVENFLKKIREKNENAMIVPFIANHDTDRAAGFFREIGQVFAAANLNLLMPGSPFIYYGEEIGMLGTRGSAQTDANRRLAMLWGDDDTVKNPAGSTFKESNQVNGTVAQQLADGDSLYNHYKKLIMIRKANPEIAYGEYKAISISGTKAAGFISTYQGSSVAVLHNTTTAAIQIDLSTRPELAAMAVTAFAGMGSATLEGTVLTIEAQTSVVLR